MTSQIQWTIYGENVGQREVCGFLNRGKQRGHTKEHYFNGEEQWRSLSESWRDHHRAFIAVEDEGGQRQVLDRAADDYVTTVQKQSDFWQNIRHCDEILYRDPENQRVSYRLTAVTVSGILTAFHRRGRSGVSHMVTAYRPRLRVRRGAPTNLQFYLAAADKFGDLLRRAEHLEPPRPKRRRRGRRR